MALLEIQNLTIDIPTSGGLLHAVRGVSFSLERGKTLAIVGESGSGKSLSSLALMDLLPRRAVRRADALRFNGIDLMCATERQKQDLRGNRMAMIFQEPMTSLNPAFTIGDQLCEVLLRHRKVSRAQARDRAAMLLEKAGITSAGTRLGQYPHQLSGGLRQRVMISMALMCEPDLIIADEPTTALDVTIQAQILRVLRDLQSEFGMAMILITHDLGVVARIADDVGVMYAGRLVETGPAAKVFTTPGHPYTRGLMDCIPTPGRTKPGERLGAIPGQVPNLVEELRGCAFRERCGQSRPACGESFSDLWLADDHRVACLSGQPAENAA